MLSLTPCRFTQKFAAIVHRERDQNFITRLHRGQLDIIPWPVIESSQFYGLFDVLRERLMKRPITHKRAVIFVDILKTLMAKLKVRTVNQGILLRLRLLQANDWGALDRK